jgi:hypothetical protein
MEKQIGFWTYWLGMACLVISLVWRIIEIWGGYQSVLGVGHLNFFHAAILFFLAAIATTGYIWAKNQKA